MAFTGDTPKRKDDDPAFTVLMELKTLPLPFSETGNGSGQEGTAGEEKEGEVSSDG